MNEKYAIVSSMNLVRYSDVQSLDIGYMVNEEEERADLREYVERYIVAQSTRTITKKHQPKVDNYLPEYIKKEIIFPEYYERCFQDINIFDRTMVFEKEYYEDSTYIKTCGFTRYNKKVGAWMHFNEYGFMTKFDFYQRGKLQDSTLTKYNYSVSLYDIVFSLVNIVGTIYKKSITIVLSL